MVGLSWTSFVYVEIRDKFLQDCIELRVKKERSNYFCFIWYWVGFSWNKLYLILYVMLDKEKKFGECLDENSN